MSVGDIVTCVICVITIIWHTILFLLQMKVLRKAYRKLSIFRSQLNSTIAETDQLLRDAETDEDDWWR